MCLRSLVLASWLALPTSVALAQPVDPVAPSPADKANAFGTGFTDTGVHQRPNQVAIMGLFTYWWFGPGLGGTLLVTIPLVHDGFLPSNNDSVDLEFGADSYFGLPRTAIGYFGIIPTVQVRWAFYVLSNVALYAKAGILVDIGVGRTWAWPVYPFPAVNGGILLHLLDTIDLKAEVGWPGVRLGIAFNLQ